MNTQPPGTAERVFALFLGLEQRARKAASIEQLAFAMVNDGQALFGFRHAALLIAGKVKALTGISVMEANAPFVAFVERAASALLEHGDLDKDHSVDPAQLDEQTRLDMNALSATHAYW